MKAQNSNTSLVVSTYNRPDALYVCLQSIKKQTVLPKEVIIGDDGSTEETRQLIESFQKDFPVPLIHVWQEDLGFRLAACRNKAIVKSTGDYIIQIDGDLILHPNFIEDHIYFSEKGGFLRGGRTYINEQRTKEFCSSGKFPALSFFSPGLIRRSHAIRSRFICQFLKERYKKNNPRVVGANMSYWKEDFLKVNGYDEFFEGWGSEDFEFAGRLMYAGIKKIRLKFAGIIFHLWHGDNYMENAQKNDEYSSKIKERGTYIAPKGADQYINKD